LTRLIHEFTRLYIILKKYILKSVNMNIQFKLSTKFKGDYTILS